MPTAPYHEDFRDFSNPRRGQRPPKGEPVEKPYERLIEDGPSGRRASVRRPDPDRWSEDNSSGPLYRPLPPSLMSAGNIIAGGLCLSLHSALYLLRMTLPASISEPMLKAAYMGVVRPFFFGALHLGLFGGMQYLGDSGPNCFVMAIKDEYRDRETGGPEYFRRMGVWSSNVWKHFKKRRNHVHPTIRRERVSIFDLGRNVLQRYRAALLNFRPGCAFAALRYFTNMNLQCFPWTVHTLWKTEDGEEKLLGCYTTMVIGGVRFFANWASEIPPNERQGIYDCLYDFEFSDSLADRGVHFMDWGCTTRKTKSDLGAREVPVTKYLSFLLGYPIMLRNDIALERERLGSWWRAEPGAGARG